MSELTQAQRDLMERNKQQALQRRAERLQQNAAQKSGQVLPPTTFYNKPTSNTPSANHMTPGPSTLTGASNQRTSISTPTRSSWPISSAASSNYPKPSTSQAASNFPSKSKLTPIPNNSPFKQKVTGQCSLISKERFVVDMPYHKRTIELFKTLQTAIYDSQCKKWNFHVKEHEVLRLKLKEVAAEVSLGYLPEVILGTFQKLSETKQPSLEELAGSTDLSRIDPVLLGKLMPFQREGVCFGVLKEGRCLIADDMGLGKTIQALGIAHYYKDDWPLLIVTPSSVRFLWAEAISSWLPTVAAHDVVVMTSGADYVLDARVLIVSYDLLSRYEQELKKMHFGAVIMDECHFLKNMKSARAKAGLAMVADARRVLLLSGTPALSRPAELFSQLKAICPTMFPWFQAFGIRYCDGKKGRFGWDFSGSSNMTELQLLLEAKFMLRRLKADVLSQLPDKNRQMIVLNPGSVKLASKEMTNFEKMLQSTKLKGNERRGTLMEYYAETGRAKLKAILDFIGDLLENGEKFICFAHHRQVLDGICEFLITKRSKCIRIDGSTPASDRQQLCDSFQSDSSVTAAILSITAANAGITLTAAKLVVFAELFWNPGILTQAEDRAHRIGQRDCVTVQYLVARGTADDHIWPLIIQKLDILNKAGLSKDNFMDSHSVQQADRNQTSIESYFQELPEDWLEDGADSWLAEIDLNNLVPEKRQKMN